jgi:hypothetical protein
LSAGFTQPHIHDRVVLLILEMELTIIMFY